MFKNSHMQGRSINPHQNAFLNNGMEHVTRKTKLGIAIQEAIKELGLEREQQKIMQCFHKTFMDKYEAFKTKATTSCIALKGSYLVDNEFPIGDQDKQQYFRAITYQVRFGNQLLSTLSTENGKRAFTLIEGYSKNQDPKKRNHSKVADRKEDKKNDKIKKKRKTN